MAFLRTFMFAQVGGIAVMVDLPFMLRNTLFSACVQTLLTVPQTPKYGNLGDNFPA
jgi:hypothetical protein